MAMWEALVTTGGGALSATIGVVAGATLTRRAQDRHWLRDKQLAAYEELLRQFSLFTMILKRAHADRRGWDYDWAVWSAALTSASLVAPAPVAVRIHAFARAIRPFLDVAAVDTRTTALTETEFEASMAGPAAAQLALVNEIRRSLGRGQGLITAPIGGAQYGGGQADGTPLR
jgi:hypothetical protein